MADPRDEVSDVDDSGLPEGALEPEHEQFVDMPDATNDAAQRKVLRRQKREQRESLAFWQGVFATAIGRREMWKLLETMHAFEDRFPIGPGGFPHPQATFFQAGQQAVGIKLYQGWLAMDFPGVHAMHVENDPRFAKPKRQRV